MTRPMSRRPLLHCLRLLLLAAWSALTLRPVSAAPPPLSQPLVALLDEAGQSHTRTRAQWQRGADGERPQMAQPPTAPTHADAWRRMQTDARGKSVLI
jgi:hypothetical protein